MFIEIYQKLEKELTTGDVHMIASLDSHMNQILNQMENEPSL